MASLEPETTSLPNPPRAGGGVGAREGLRRRGKVGLARSAAACGQGPASVFCLGATLLGLGWHCDGQAPHTSSDPQQPVSPNSSTRRSGPALFVPRAWPKQALWSVPSVLSETGFWLRVAIQINPLKFSSSDALATFPGLNSHGGWWLSQGTGQMVYNATVVEVSAGAEPRGARPPGAGLRRPWLLPCAPAAAGEVAEVLGHSECSIRGL